MSDLANDALIPAAPRTTLVEDPDARPVYTANRELDARKSLARGLIEYLQGRALDLPGGRRVTLPNAYTSWPENEQDAVFPAIVCTPGGAESMYDSKSLTPVINPDQRLALGDGRYLVEWAELTVDLRLELHCNDSAEREGLTALIEDAFCPVDWMSGFRLALPHYFGQHASYLPISTMDLDSAETVAQRLRIAHFTVRASIGVTKLFTLPTMRPSAVVTVGPPVVAAVVVT